jgi:hypothetical protein
MHPWLLMLFTDKAREQGTPAVTAASGQSAGPVNLTRTIWHAMRALSKAYYTVIKINIIKRIST